MVVGVLGGGLRKAGVCGEDGKGTADQILSAFA